VTLIVHHAAISHVGRQRPGNEDAFLAQPPLYAVADGMGGAKAGEVASGMAVLLSTAYMDEAARCHRVCLLRAGRVVAEGEPARLVSELEKPVFEVLGGDREALHRMLSESPGVVAASPAGERLRVAVLGVMAIHKGLELLEQCAESAARSGLPLAFSLMETL